MAVSMSNGLKDVWKNSFLVGAAVNSNVLKHKETDSIIKRHFSSLTMENSMKLGLIQPEENKWNWDECDFVVDYAKKNDLRLRGHTMIWHNQNPPWLFVDGDREVSKTKLFKRLEDHIETVTKRYNDTIYAWDVVNEAIDTDKGDENGFRLTNWYKIFGTEIYDFAFKCMREANPNAKLFLNDYNNEIGPKMDATIRFLSSLLDRGIPIDGVGLQGHWYYNFPDEKVLREALQRYSALGLNIELTEVDISVYQWGEAREESDFFKTRPEERILEQFKRYMEIFTIASEYPAVKNITTWGVADNYTWLDDFPVKNRKNWPLLFDEHCAEKPVVEELIKADEKKK